MTNQISGQPLSVQDLKRIADEKETAKLQEVLTRRQKEEDEEKRARQDFMEREIRPDGIERFNSWVRRAAEQGRSRDRDPALPVAVLHGPRSGHQQSGGRLAGDADRRRAQGATRPMPSTCRHRATRSARRS